MQPDLGGIHTKVTAAKDFSVNGQNYIEDRFNNVLYTFRAGHSITLPPDAARHIFGVVPGETRIKVNSGVGGDAMFNHFTKRAGWNTPAMAPKAKALWEKLKFEPVVMQMVEMPVKELAKDEAA